MNTEVTNKSEFFDPSFAIDAIKKATESVKKPLFTSVSELISKPRKTDWLIKDYLEMDSTALLFGESGAGKSFCVIDMALCVATGTAWHGHDVKQGAVFYVAGEGHCGFAKRFLSWSEHTGTNIKNAPLFLSNRSLVLPEDDLLADLIAQIDESGHKPALIVFDTLARSLNGDENSAKDIGGFIQAIDTLRDKYGCCVLTVHHTGHGNGERARGSSALKAAMDTEIGLTNKDGLKQLEVTKQKNHEPPSPKYFKLQSASTPWADEDGNPINSAVLVLDEGGTAGTKRNKAKKLTIREDAVLTSLSRALNEHGVEPTPEIKARFGGFGGHGIHLKIVHVDHWRAEAYPIIDADSTDKKKVAFQRARAKLQDFGIAQTMGDYWWIIDYTVDNRNGTEQNGTIVPTCSGISGVEPERNGTHLFRGVPVVPANDTQQENIDGRIWDYQNGRWLDETIPQV